MELALMWCDPNSITSTYNVCDTSRSRLDKWNSAAEEVMTGGFAVKSAFESITPPSEISTAHKQVIECTNRMLDMAHAATAFFKDGSTDYLTSLSKSSEPCAFLDSALQQIQTFSKSAH